MPSYFFTNATIQIGLFFIVLFLLAKPLGSYMARVYSNNVVFLEKFFGFIERGFYRLAKIDRNVEMDWKQYAFSVLLFSLFGFLLLFVILLFQNLVKRILTLSILIYIFSLGNLGRGTFSSFFPIDGV